MLATQPIAPIPSRTSSTLRRDLTSAAASSLGHWFKGLPAEGADDSDERVHLLGLELVAERIHAVAVGLLHAVEDRRLDLLVRRLLLPRGVRHVGDLHLLP